MIWAFSLYNTLPNGILIEIVNPPDPADRFNLMPVSPLQHGSMIFRSLPARKNHKKSLDNQP
jgi:hypothetical protein